MIRTDLIESHEVKIFINDVLDPSIPASISALRLREPPNLLNSFAWEKYAVDVIRAAILELIAGKVLGVLQASYRRSVFFLRFPQQTVFLLSEEPNASVSRGGRLEEKIRKAISLPECRRISEITFPGAFVDKVVWSVIGSFQIFPSQLVVHSVQLDAEQRGWGTSKGLISPEFDPAPDRLAELVREKQKLTAMVKRVASDYPEFHRALSAQIRKGIRSRLEIPAWDAG